MPDALPPNWRRLSPLRATLVAASGVLGDTFLNSLTSVAVMSPAVPKSTAVALAATALLTTSATCAPCASSLKALGTGCLAAAIALFTSARNSRPKAVSWYTMARSVMPMDTSFCVRRWASSA
ncbi:hypothetical protein D3C72_1651230 [compost metagenome]